MEAFYSIAKRAGNKEESEKKERVCERKIISTFNQSNQSSDLQMELINKPIITNALHSNANYFLEVVVARSFFYTMESVGFFACKLQSMNAIRQASRQQA